MPYKRKRGQHQNKIVRRQMNYQTTRNKRWVVERTNSWYNRFRKLFVPIRKESRKLLGSGATIMQYHYI